MLKRYIYLYINSDTNDKNNISAITRLIFDITTIVYVTLIVKSADSGLMGLKSIPYTATLIV